MAHVFMFVPVLALVLFLFLPGPLALAAYLPIGLFSLAIAYKAMKAQRLPPVNGQEAMIGDQAVASNGGTGRIRVRYRSEIWHAFTSQTLYRDQQVLIEDVRGLTLWVTPLVGEMKEEARETD